MKSAGITSGHSAIKQWTQERFISVHVANKRWRLFTVGLVQDATCHVVPVSPLHLHDVLVQGLNHVMHRCMHILSTSLLNVPNIIRSQHNNNEQSTNNEPTTNSQFEHVDESWSAWMVASLSRRWRSRPHGLQYTYYASITMHVSSQIPNILFIGLANVRTNLIIEPLCHSLCKCKFKHIHAYRNWKSNVPLSHLCHDSLPKRMRNRRWTLIVWPHT